MFKSRCDKHTIGKTGTDSSIAKHSATVCSVMGRQRLLFQPRITGSVARLRTLTSQWPCVKPFTGNDDVSIPVKSSRVGRKPRDEQTDIYYMYKNGENIVVLLYVLRLNIFILLYYYFYILVSVQNRMTPRDLTMIDFFLIRFKVI